MCPNKLIFNLNTWRPRGGHHHLIEGKDKDDRLRGQDNPAEAQENPPPGGYEKVEYLRGTQSR
jgi:hypothetical protein